VTCQFVQCIVVEL